MGKDSYKSYPLDRLNPEYKDVDELDHPVKKGLAAKYRRHS
jgi:hypothetical protein